MGRLVSFSPAVELGNLRDPAPLRCLTSSAAVVFSLREPVPLGCLTRSAPVDSRVWDCEMKPIGSQHWTAVPVTQGPVAVWRANCLTTKPALHRPAQIGPLPSQ